MSPFIETLDLVLRNPSTLFADILRGERVTGTILVLSSCIVTLMATYGLMMGVRSGYRQMLASAVKVPALFLVTLGTCLPLLFIVNVLQGSKLELTQMVAMMLMGLTLTSLLMMSCAPIVGFFGLSSEYQFMKLAHVVVLAFGAAWGLKVLGRGLEQAKATALLYPHDAHSVFRLWIIIYVFVGTQMAWFLRPFVGDPALPFQFLRDREPGMNFYLAVWRAFTLLRRQWRNTEAAANAKPAVDESTAPTKSIAPLRAEQGA